MQADVPTRDELRDEFNAAWSYGDLSESDIYVLESLLIIECMNPGDHMRMHPYAASIQVRHRGGSGTRQKDEGLQSAFLRVDGPYFTDREAISFNEDGFIGFCGWADGHNSAPILKAFCAVVGTEAGDAQ